MSQIKSRVVLGNHFWSGIYGWFARGGEVSGPPEVRSTFAKLLQRDVQRTILRLLNEILTYSLLFEEIYLPPTQDPGLSEGLKRDMAQCLGARVVSREKLQAFAETGRERAEHHLSLIVSRDDAIDLTSRLYRIAGPFAADRPDLLPVLQSMDTSVHLARNLGAKLNCQTIELPILEIVAENATQPSVDERLDVVQKIFRAHSLPILTLKAFGDEKGVVDLERMFLVMERLRKSKRIVNFRKKVSEIADVGSGDIEQVITQDIVQDFRTTLEEYVLQPNEIGKRLSTAVLKDVLGIIVPVPTGTALEGISIARKKRRSRSLEWRLFVFEYGDVVSDESKDM